MPGIIIPDDVSDGMKAELIVEELLGLARRKYNMRKYCRVIDTGTRLQGRWPVATKLAGHEKVPALVEAAVSAQAYTDLTFNLWKNVVHLAIAREAEFDSIVDLMRSNIQDAARDLARMENKQIAEIVPTYTSVAGGNWSSTDNPLDDIMPLVGTIQDLGYDPNAIVMQSLVYADFLANENIREVYERGATVARLGIEMIGSLQIGRESGLVAETAWLLDTEAPAATLFDGPSIVEQYTMASKFARGYATGKFLEPVKTLDDAAREMTGLLS